MASAYFVLQRLLSLLLHGDLGRLERVLQHDPALLDQIVAWLDRAEGEG